MKRTLALATILLLAACGQRVDLRPAAGQSMPPVAYGGKAQPDSESLLKPDTLAAPERSVELRKRSEEREDDAFDLPPE